MYFKCLVLCFLTAASISGGAQVLISNTNVIDVENKKILKGYDVVALDGKIISVEKGKKYKLPGGTQVIDGTGKYLIPGLTDAHIHFFQSGGLYARPDAIDLRKFRPYADELKWVHDHMDEFLRRYAAAGITTVIDVGASNKFLGQKDSFLNKPFLPTVKMTGPLLTTYVPEPYKKLDDESPFVEMTSEDVTRKAVKDQVLLKTDFIKIWYIITNSDKEKGARTSLPLIQAAIDEAHANGLRVAVHATEQIAAKLAVEAGADFLVHNVDDEIVSDSFVQLLKKKKVVLIPTMVVAGNYGKALSGSYKFSTDELSLVNPTTAGSIIDFPWPDTTAGNRISKIVKRNPAPQIKMDSILSVNLKRLLDGGVIIATGTDAGNIGTQHVGSYYTELMAMKEVGFDMWQLLQSSTINGAMVLNRQAEDGSIVKGKWANMVLLNGNPIDSLPNWRKIDWVITKGNPQKPDSILNSLSTPESLAQQQLNAYNAHDLEAFLAPYSEDVEIYEFPNKLQLKGKEAMRKSYQFVERTPELYCRLLKRIVQGNIVIDHEEVMGFGAKPVYGIAIYQIEKGKITKVWFP